MGSEGAETVEVETTETARTVETATPRAAAISTFKRPAPISSSTRVSAGVRSNRAAWYTLAVSPVTFACASAGRRALRW